MKTKNSLQRSLGTCLLLGLLMTTTTFGQTNIQFTSVVPTIEGAIQLTWTSTNHELYEIDEADVLNSNIDGTTTWNKLYDSYPSQGTNTFWLDTGNYNLSPQILHPKYMPMRFYRIADEGADTTSDEPTVTISSPTNSSLVNGELTINVTAFTDQPLLAGTKLYVNGQEMPAAVATTNYAVGSTNYEVDTYNINTCEWPNGTNILFATAECESGFGDAAGSGPVASGHAVSPFVPVDFNNLVTMISFSQPSFNPALGETQQVSAYFAVNADWTLNITDASSNVVQTASGSGTSLSYAWDGTSNGTNLPNGIYFYYITADTNSESFESEAMLSGRFSSFGSSGSLGSGTELVEVPLPPMPPGLASDDQPQTMLVERPMEAMSVPSPGDGGGSTGSPATPAVVFTTPLPAPQPVPPTPQRPPTNPIKGQVGTFGIAYDTFGKNGTNGFTLGPLLDGSGLGTHIQFQGNSGTASINYPPMQLYSAEGKNFASQMQHFGWGSGFVQSDDQWSIGNMRGSGTPFNGVNVGVYMGHGVYGTSPDYSAGGCKQMYFPVTSGTGAQYLRMSEMSLGGAGTNGLKWMSLIACHSLYHVNWSSMQSASVRPYNSNLHLILGADTDEYSNYILLWDWAKYMNFGTSTNYSPLTVRAAWYQAATDAYGNSTLPSGLTMTFAVAGDSACLSDSLQTNSTPGGSWSYGTQQVYPAP